MPVWIWFQTSYYTAGMAKRIFVCVKLISVIIICYVCSVRLLRSATPLCGIVCSCLHFLIKSALCISQCDNHLFIWITASVCEYCCTALFIFVFLLLIVLFLIHKTLFVLYFCLATDLLDLCVIVISFIMDAFVCAFVTWIKDYLLTYLLT